MEVEKEPNSEPAQYFVSCNDCDWSIARSMDEHSANLVRQGHENLTGHTLTLKIAEKHETN